MPFSVVIADDDPFIPTMVKTMLDRDGRFEVYAATNGNVSDTEFEGHNNFGQITTVDKDGNITSRSYSS